MKEQLSRLCSSSASVKQKKNCLFTGRNLQQAKKHKEEGLKEGMGEGAGLTEGAEVGGGV